MFDIKSGKGKDGLNNPQRRVFLKRGVQTMIGLGLGVSGIDSVARWVVKQPSDELFSPWKQLSPEEKKQIVGVVEKYDAVVSIDEIPSKDNTIQQVVFTFGTGSSEDEELSGEDQLTKLNELIKERIKTTDYKMLEKLFIEQYLNNGKIDIDLEIKSGVQKSWEKKYDKGGVLHKGLLESLDRMKPWYNEIKNIFENTSQAKGIDIPEELIYLAIPESHCKTRDTSSASAGGYYQLMKLISEDKKLVMEKGIDERFDVLENARVASEYLVDLYTQFKTETNTEEDIWRLVLARYNGVYSKDFKKYIAGSDYLKNYKTFLEFRESRINKYLEEVFTQGYFENYKVRRGETLESIAQKCNVNLEELKQLNNKTTISVQRGEKISIPVFRGQFEYEVKQGDSLWRIAEMYNVTKDSIANSPENTDKIGESYIIKPGVMLTIKIDDADKAKLRQSLKTIFKIDLHSSLENLNYPEKFYAIIEVMKKNDLLFNNLDDTTEMKKIKGGNKTLKEISINQGIALKSLKVVNPHILKDDVIIPSSVMVYISPKIIVTKHRRTKKKF